MRQRRLIISATGLSMVVLLGACGKESEVSSKDAVYVTAVSELVTTDLGSYNRYSGVVVSQGTTNVKKDSSREIGEVLVEVGDEVEVGQVLFTYDLSKTEMSIQEGQLEIERYNNQITSYQQQLQDLNTQKAKATTAEEQLSFNIEIQTVETQIREVQYSISTKQLEIQSLQASMSETQVVAPVAGTIQSIGTSSSSSDMSGGSDTSSGENYIEIVESGDYRIKGIINEKNASELAVGSGVIIRSRQDESTTWTGVIDSIDYENPEKSNSNYYYDSSSSDMTNSSKYPFYVTLNSSENLIMGQHVYIEPDYGQGEQMDKEGIWLPEWYIVQESDSSYVWAVDDSEKLEQRAITLGEYDENTSEYQIVGGLSLEDYIAFPDESLTVGSPTTTEFIYNDVDESENLDNDADGFIQEPENQEIGSEETLDNQDFEGVEETQTPNEGVGGEATVENSAVSENISNMEASWAVADIDRGMVSGNNSLEEFISRSQEEIS